MAVVPSDAKRQRVDTPTDAATPDAKTSAAESPDSSQKKPLMTVDAVQVYNNTMDTQVGEQAEPPKVEQGQPQKAEQTHPPKADTHPQSPNADEPTQPPTANEPTQPPTADKQTHPPKADPQTQPLTVDKQTHPPADQQTSTKADERTTPKADEQTPIAPGTPGSVAETVTTEGGGGDHGVAGGRKKPKKVDPIVKAVQVAQVFKNSYTSAYASAQTLKTEIASNTTEAAYVWANSPTIVGPLNEALDAVTTAIRSNPHFKALIAKDVKVARAEYIKSKKPKDEFDRAIMEFPERVHDAVEKLATETRLLNASIQARIQERKDGEEAKAAALLGQGATQRGSAKKRKAPKAD